VSVREREEDELDALRKKMKARITLDALGTIGTSKMESECADVGEPGAVGDLAGYFVGVV
jgi:hypothetical protein